MTRPISHPAARAAALVRCSEALAEPDQPGRLFRSLDVEMAAVIGHKLFTIMVLDHDRGVAERLYTNQPDAYPVQGCKPLGTLKEWGKRVLEEGEPFLGKTREAIRQVFPDYEVIESIGCGSVINLPIIYGGQVLGTVNLLHEENYYTDTDLKDGAPFAQLAIPACKGWADSLTLV